MPARFTTHVPAVNITEEDESFQIEVAALGMEKSDFHVDVESGQLIISVEKEEKKKEDDKNYTRREYNYESFNRSFMLPESVMTDDIKACYENGVLNITLPKEEEVKVTPKKEIAVG